MKLVFFVLIFACSPILLAKVSSKKTTPVEDQEYTKYLATLQEMKNQICPASVQQEYDALLQEYRSSTFFIPLIDNLIDLDAIDQSYPALEKKRTWLMNEVEKISKLEKLPDLKDDLKGIRKNIDELLDYKYRFFVKNEKKDIEKLSKTALGNLQKRWALLLKKIEYLQNPFFPINHFENRKKYEELFESAKVKERNILYVQRKIWEDGTYDEEHKNSDSYTRSALDMVTHRMNDEGPFLPEELRADLEWLVDRVERYQKMGKKDIEARLRQWLRRTSDHLKFYQSIEQMTPQERRRFSHNIANSQRALETFVANKQAEVYDYWLKQKDREKEFFVIETILLHEVGGLDRSKIERQTIADVIGNRVTNKEFNQLNPNQPLMTAFKNKKIKNHQDKWLNVLFRKGEFSFTYFYIPASVQIFCPELTAPASRLRVENFEISKKLLDRKKIENKNVIGYFSRVSMPGRIDMTDIWKHWKLVGEVPGQMIQSPNKQRENYRNKKFRYFYTFPFDGKTYHVFDLNGETTVMRFKGSSADYFEHRNQDVFKYFELI